MLARLTDLDLPPDAFAVVMATGIVSVAAHDHDYRWIEHGLVVVAVVAFVVLLGGLVVRVLARPASAMAEARDPDVALRLFTFVAASAVLGVCLRAHPVLVAGFDAAAAVAWLGLAPLAVRDVRSRPRSELRDHAHGAWLLASVATSGLSISAAHRATGSDRSGWLLVAAVAWVVALLLYLAVAWLIAWRALAAPFRPDQVTPDSWILMGALAIGTLAGDSVLGAARGLGSAHHLSEVTRPATLALWLLASLWIPVLLYAEVWQAERRAGSLHFAGVWWAAVFPLGMYATATEATAVQLDLRSLTTVSLVFFWIALAAWLLVASGWLHSLLRRRTTDVT